MNNQKAQNDAQSSKKEKATKKAPTIRKKSATSDEVINFTKNLIKNWNK